MFKTDRTGIHVRRHCDYGKNGTFIILVIIILLMISLHIFFLSQSIHLFTLSYSFSPSLALVRLFFISLSLFLSVLFCLDIYIHLVLH